MLGDFTIRLRGCKLNFNCLYPSQENKVYQNSERLVNGPCYIYNIYIYIFFFFSA